LGFNDQEIFNLALTLQSNVSNKESLESDLNKYGSLKRLIQELTEELRILESTAMESIGFTCRLNMRIDVLERWQRKDYAILPFSVEAAGRDRHQDNCLGTEIVDTTKLAPTNPDASYVINGINRLNSSDSAKVLSDEHEDDRLLAHERRQAAQEAC
jgi:hypothetical protein